MKTNDIFDYIIIGSGLSGLTMAKALQKLSSKILLLDGADVAGGQNHMPENGLRILPGTELAESALSFLQEVVGRDLSAQFSFKKIETSPVTFESGSLRPFVGFGENPPEFYEELQYFLSAETIEFGQGPADWCRALAGSLEADHIFRPRSLVTKFIVENGLATGVVVNGQKTIHAHNFIYCGPVRDLHVLLPEDTLSHRQKLKLSKGKYWTAVGLDIKHAEKVTDSHHIHLLNGTTNDDLGPCVGQFAAVEPGTEIHGQLSQWVSFLDNEDSEESENIANALKKIKRQIKRAYPEAMEKDKIIFERILVAPAIGGNGELKLSANQSLSSLPNFFIASGTVNSQKNILGSLCQAQLVASALGYKKDEVFAETQRPEFLEEAAAHDDTYEAPAEA
jgi:hypothetical protein